MIDAPKTTGRCDRGKPLGAESAGVTLVLRLEQWKKVARLPVPVGEVLLRRVRLYGWVETRDE